MAVRLSPEFLSGLAFGITMLLVALLGYWLDHRRRAAAHRSPRLPIHDHPTRPIVIHYHNWNHPPPIWWTSHPHPRPQIEMPRRHLLDPPPRATQGRVIEVEDQAEQPADVVVNQGV
ncbi:hypothetical protein CLCR_07743 [Cladophialophora carrionii]|uniref:Uncharacterized protein n=1 Tax=Cladophialophora carrionii TaxID=86049 RepID=A0A1C1CM99_9EURO|nr:hypothetical protein CLCR_07743 [Cladophialophora carrionii]